MREIEAKAEKGNKECQLALDMNAYQIRKYIGSYSCLEWFWTLLCSLLELREFRLYSSISVLIWSIFGLELDLEKTAFALKKSEKLIRQVLKQKYWWFQPMREVEIANQVYDLLS